MKKILAITFALCVATVFAKTYTEGTRFDTTTTAGATYIGKAEINRPALAGFSEAQLTAQPIWALKKITSDGTYFGGGDENGYTNKWDDRATATYK